MSLIAGRDAGDLRSQHRHTFVGREALCRTLDDLVGSAPQGGAATVILGEPGIGKTALLHRIAGHSAARVLQVTGLETETVLPYAAAADLLLPLQDHFGVLPSVQQRAIEAALALGDGPAGPHLAVCAAALGILAAAADREPILVLVDDLQWVDLESRRLLMFVARRLSSERVIMILAQREEPGEQPPDPVLPAIRLMGLTTAECHELLAASGHDVPAADLVAIVQATGGNPLAILESRAAGHLLDGAHPGNGLPIGPRLQRAWAAALERLPPPTRHALFLLAITRATATPSLMLLLRAIGLALEDLAPAEAQFLIVVEPDRILLRHPLLRHVLLDMTPLSVRVPTYRALAELVPREQQAWYRSLATIGADDALAADLETAATEARDRGGHSAAARLLRRSAELTTATAQRAARLLTAGQDALLAGDAVSAELWSRQASALEPSPGFTAGATLLRGSALTWLGHPADAYDQLLRVADDIEPGHPGAAAELLWAAAMPAAMTGDVRRSRSAALRADAVLERTGLPPSLEAHVTGSLAAILSGDGADGDRRVRAAQAMLGRIDPVRDMLTVAMLAQALSWTERHDDARRLMNATVDTARQHGTSHVLAFALATRAEVGIWTGRWSSAYADLYEARQWAEDSHLHSTLGFVLVLMGRIEAARGHRDRCEDHVARSRREAGPYQVDCLLVYEPAVLGLAALSAGEPGLAVEHLEGAWAQAQRLGLNCPVPVPFGADLAEAHILGGDPGRAHEIAGWLGERAAATGAAFPGLAASRVRGLLALDPEVAAGHFRAARELARRTPMPFELARTLLCEGQVLRRNRHQRAARAVLREAQRLFEGLGAGPWAVRAERELEASGAGPRPDRARRAESEALTPQELQIARMIAGGRNNPETAAALFLSRKTVEAHLTRIYRKLDVRSRSQLTAVMLERGMSD